MSIFKILQKVFSSSIHINKGQVYDFAKEWFGSGLVTNDGGVKIINLS
jgi:hypothetical protein